MLLRILLAWERRSRTLDYLLEQYLKAGNLEPAQRAQITDGACNWARGRGAARYLLTQKLRKPSSKLPDDARLLLELAVCRILNEERTPKEIIVSQAVEDINFRHGAGLGGMANAVLRSIAGGDYFWPDATESPAGFLAASTSHPAWIIERWLSRWGFERTQQQALWDNIRPSIWLRNNWLRGDSAGAQEKLKESQIEFETHPEFDGYFKLKSPLYPHAAAFVRRGDFSIQDPSASLAVRLLEPKPGMKILDLCAAPGGKTAHLAELGANEAVIVAVDKSAQRLKKLREALTRLGIGGVAAVAADGGIFDSQKSGFGLFDAVLVDVPCSGLGVLSRRADLRWRRKPEEIAELAPLQEKLLRSGSRCVRPGGALIYSTCTIEPEENEQVVLNFVEGSEAFVLDEAPAEIPPRFVIGPGQISTISPSDGMDGVYAARLIRSA